MFNSILNPPRSDYNVPFKSLRPEGNTVNIDSDGSGNDPSRGMALGAFQRLVSPYLRLFDQSWVTQPNGQLAPRPGLDTNPFHDQGKAYGGPFQPTMDYNAIAQNFFNRTEDQQQVRDYFDMPSFKQSPVGMWG